MNGTLLFECSRRGVDRLVQQASDLSHMYNDRSSTTPLNDDPLRDPLHDAHPSRTCIRNRNRQQMQPWLCPGQGMSP